MGILYAPLSPRLNHFSHSVSTRGEEIGPPLLPHCVSIFKRPLSPSSVFVFRFYRAPRFPFAPEEMPHFHKARGSTYEAFALWRSQVEHASGKLVGIALECRCKLEVVCGAACRLRHTGALCSVVYAPSR